MIFSARIIQFYMITNQISFNSWQRKPNLSTSVFCVDREWRLSFLRISLRNSLKTALSRSSSRLVSCSITYASTSVFLLQETLCREAFGCRILYNTHRILHVSVDCSLQLDISTPADSVAGNSWGRKRKEKKTQNTVKGACLSSSSAPWCIFP